MVRLIKIGDLMPITDMKCIICGKRSGRNTYCYKHRYRTLGEKATKEAI